MAEMSLRATVPTTEAMVKQIGCVIYKRFFAKGGYVVFRSDFLDIIAVGLEAHCVAEKGGVKVRSGVGHTKEHIVGKRDKLIG